MLNKNLGSLLIFNWTKIALKKFNINILKLNKKDHLVLISGFLAGLELNEY